MTSEDRVQKVLKLPNGKEILEGIKTMEPADPNSPGVPLDMDNPKHQELVIAMKILAGVDS